MVQGWNTSAIKLLLNPSSYTLLIPSKTVANITKINWSDLNSQGIRAIAFDKDNTLTAPYSSVLHPEFSDSWKECKRVFGDKVCIVRWVNMAFT